jgi:hypothetical protein
MLEHTAAESTQNTANRELREALALIKKHITEENSQQNHDLYQAMQLVVDASRRVGLWQDPENKPEVGVRNQTGRPSISTRADPDAGLIDADDPRNQA